MTVYEDVEQMYDADHARRASPELDFGVWWYDDGGATWRVTWIDATGEFYAIRLGGPVVKVAPGLTVLMAGTGQLGPVTIIGHAPTRELAEAYMDGWADKCGQPGSLAWAIARVASKGAS